MKKAKTQIKHYDQNPVEAITSIGGSVGKALVEDAGKELIGDLWDQILGVEPQKQQKTHGDLAEGQELDFKKQKREVYKDPGIDYRREIIHTQKTESVRENREIKVRIQEIVIELKKLVKSSSELEIQFKEVSAIERVPENAGTYHVNFFEWVLSTIRSAQTKVESASSWMSHMKGKKNKRDYWSSFKKHGTSFGLSGERMVATQVG